MSTMWFDYNTSRFLLNSNHETEARFFVGLMREEQVDSQVSVQYDQTD